MISQEKLKANGFQGFKSINALEENNIYLPNEMGVYIVLTPDNFKINFIDPGSGGFYNGKDPNVSLDELKSNWLEVANIVYIGKAGGTGINATLYSRIKQYLKFGKGKAVGHKGGRLIWQIKNSGDLIMCWKVLKDVEPENYESELINAFKKTYGKRPFANLRD